MTNVIPFPPQKPSQKSSKEGEASVIALPLPKNPEQTRNILRMRSLFAEEVSMDYAAAHLIDYRWKEFNELVSTLMLRCNSSEKSQLIRLLTFAFQDVSKISFHDGFSSE